MKIQVLKGATSLITHIFLQDSSSTTGAGLTALTNATCGTFYWMRSDKSSSTSATINSITTLGTYAGSATNAAFKLVDDTNMPGVYELHWPNNAIASGANQVVGILKGGTNAAPLVIEIQLTSFDPNDAVRMGVTALPNANAAATGGLATVDANNAVKVQSGTAANQINLSAGNVALQSLDSFVQQSGTAQAGAAGTITLAAGASATDNLYNGQTVKIYSGTGVGQTRVILSYIGATKIGTVDRNWITNPDATSVYAVLSSSNPKLDSSLQVTAASVQGNVTGSVASVTGAVGSVTGAVGSVTAGVTVSTNNDKTGYSLASLDSLVLQSGTAQAGAAGTITLAAGASATDNLYNGETIKIYSGTGAGQTRVILSYVGSTKIGTLDRNWITNPDATSVYAVLATSNPKLDSSLQVTAASVQGNVTGSVASVTGAVGSVTGNVGGNVVGSVASVTGAVGSVTGNVGGNVVGSVNSVTTGVTVTTNNDKTGYSLASLDSLVLHNGTAQAGAAGTITLAAGASATDNLYNGETIKIYSGTGAGQTRVILSYVGATKIGTVDRNWITNPDATSVYAVLASSNPKVDSSLQVTAASVQGNVTGSVNSVTGAVGSVTGNVGGNVVGSVNSVTSGVTVSTNNDKTAYSLTAGERTSIADAHLTRDMSAVSGEAAKSPLNAFRKIHNKFSISGTTLTVYKEDGTTVAYTETLTTDAAGIPIIGSTG